jgi:hypothetical protein
LIFSVISSIDVVLLKQNNTKLISEKSNCFLFGWGNNFILAEIKTASKGLSLFLIIVAQKRERQPTKTMKINIITILYGLGVALLAASIHAVLSTNKHFEVDDFQIGVDQEVGNVSCYLLVDTSDNTSGIPLLSTRYAHLFGFRYDPRCKR